MKTGTWEEGTAYGIPYVSCRGKRLLYYSATKKWISLHPFPDTLDAFRERLESYSLSKGTIRFPTRRRSTMTCSVTLSPTGCRTSSLIMASKVMKPAKKTLTRTPHPDFRSYKRQKLMENKQP